MGTGTPSTASEVLTLPRGRQLYKYIQQNMECISTGESTYWPADPNKTPDLLDFYICKDIRQSYLHVQSSTDLSSDHTPTILTISSEIILKEETQKLSTRYTNWEVFRNYINESSVLNMPLKNAEQIEAAVEHFNNMIQSAAWNATPITKKKN